MNIWEVIKTREANKRGYKVLYVYNNKVYTYWNNTKVKYPQRWRIIRHSSDNLEEVFKEDINEGWKIIRVD